MLLVPNTSLVVFYHLSHHIHFCLRGFHWSPELLLSVCLAGQSPGELTPLGVCLNEWLIEVGVNISHFSQL